MVATKVFAVTVNLKTAGALRLSVPPSLLARADEVIGTVRGDDAASRDP